MMIIDPARITRRQAKILQAYLLQHPDFQGIFFEKGVGQRYSCHYKGKQISFTLTHSLFRRTKFKNHGIDYYDEFVVCGREIGRGKFGIVYNIIGSLSLDRYPYETFAFKRKSDQGIIKVQHHFLDFEPESTFKEYHLLMRTPHINPKFYRYYAENFRSVIITNKCRGISLRELLDQETNQQIQISLQDRLRLSSNLLRALKEQVHDRKVVHRDLKPENIVIGDDYSVSIIDFGLSRLSGANGNDGKSCGDLRYIAPEGVYVQGDPWVCLDEKSDVFSMGKIIGEIWGARNLYARGGMTLYEMILLIQKNEPLELFYGSRAKSDLRNSLRNRITHLVHDMMQTSRKSRIALDDAINQFDEIRFDSMSNSNAATYLPDIKRANMLAQQSKISLSNYYEHDDFTTAGMIQLLIESAGQLADNQYSINEFIITTGLATADRFSNKSELLKQLQQSYVECLANQEKISSLSRDCRRQISLDFCLADDNSHMREQNYSRLALLIRHEADKVKSGRLEISEVLNFSAKTQRKIEYFKSMLHATTLIGAWKESVHADTISNKLTALMCDPLVSHDDLQQQVLRVLLTCLRDHARTRGGCFFAKERMVSAPVIKFMNAVMSLIVCGASGNELINELQKLKPSFAVTNWQVHKLYQLVMQAAKPAPSAALVNTG